MVLGSLLGNLLHTKLKIIFVSFPEDNKNLHKWHVEKQYSTQENLLPIQFAI